MLGLLAAVRNALGRFLESRFAFHAVIAVLLFVPHLFGSPMSEPPWYFGVPRISSGDEPHYLVYVHSIVEDGDLSLANNYRSVHEGSDHAGWIFRGGRLNHHTTWYVGDKLIHWHDVYDTDESKWQVDANGHPVPVVRERVLKEPKFDSYYPPAIERPWNSPGLPLLLSPFFFFARNTSWIEPLATVLAGLAVLLASIFWRMLARVFTDDRRIINIGVAFAILGTPAWHYGRSFFSEPFIMCLVTGAYAFALGKKQRLVVSGMLVGASFFIKPIALLLGVPIGAYFLFRREFRKVALYTVPVILWLGANLVQNKLLYGGFFRTSNEWVSGWPLLNTVHMFLNPQRGLLMTAPIVLVSAFGWRTLVRENRIAALVPTAFALFFLLATSNRAWAGGFAYSLRFMAPMLPLFCIGVLPLLKPPMRSLVVFFGVISICINGLAAVQYWRSFHANSVLYLVPNSEYDPK